MKNKIFILIYILITPALIYGQDFLGGEISSQYINGGPMEVHVRLYTDASYGIDRPYVKLHVHDAAFQAIPKIFDTIVAPGVRHSYYKGLSSYQSSGLGTVYIYDTIPTSRFKNLNFPTDSLTRIQFSSAYYDFHNDPLYSNDMPLCADNFVHFEVNEGVIEYQLDCIDPNGDSLAYSINNMVGGVSPSHYNLPPGVSISPSGIFTWDSPTETGLYVFSIFIEDVHIDGAIMERLFFMKIDSLMILSPTTWIENNNYLQVFPNPTSDQLTVKFDYFAPDDTQIQIFDMTGRVVHQQQMTKQSHQVDMEHLADGIYVVRVRSGDKIITRKVVKQ